MSEFTEPQLTESVIQSFATTRDPRLREVLGRLVSCLHAFVRDVDLSFDEWRAAIDFLTRTGHTSSATRQEFILLSDVLGVSMLVDALAHRHHTGATESTVLGPFYIGEHRVVPNGTALGGDAPGGRVFVDASVGDVAGRPIARAAIDVWHADPAGL